MTTADGTATEPTSSAATATETELRTQPETWRRAIEMAPQFTEALPRKGETVLITGCGTSWFMAMAYAKLREVAGEGITDAATATEVSTARTYDRIIALSRSGTTTEIVDLLRETDTPSVLITAVAGGPAAEFADAEIVLDFADETSVVQTRFATSALMLLRASLGEDLTGAIADVEQVLATEPPAEWIDAEQVTFLGTGWNKGLADEAALKLREATSPGPRRTTRWSTVTGPSRSPSPVASPTCSARPPPVSSSRWARQVRPGSLPVWTRPRSWRPCTCGRCAGPRSWA